MHTNKMLFCDKKAYFVYSVECIVYSVECRVFFLWFFKLFCPFGIIWWFVNSYKGGRSVWALIFNSDVKKIVTMPCKRIQTGVREKYVIIYEFLDKGSLSRERFCIFVTSMPMRAICTVSIMLMTVSGTNIIWVIFFDASSMGNEIYTFDFLYISTMSVM